MGNVSDRGGVTGRDPFYLTAGIQSDTREKQQERKGMKAGSAQKDWGHMRPGCLRGARHSLGAWTGCVTEENT